MGEGESGGLDDDYVGVDVLLDVLESGLQSAGQGAADASVGELDRVVALRLQCGPVDSDGTGFVYDKRGLESAFGVHGG